MSEETYKGLRPKAPAQFGQVLASNAVSIQPEPRPTLESMCSNLHKQAEEILEAINELNKKLSPILWQDPATLGPCEEIEVSKSYPCVALDSLSQLQHKLKRCKYGLHDIQNALAL
jgi:uncharacterized protein YecE (DUF72 family)